MKRAGIVVAVEVDGGIGHSYSQHGPAQWCDLVCRDERDHAEVERYRRQREVSATCP